MKRVLLLILTFALVAALSSCDVPRDGNEDEGDFVSFYGVAVPVGGLDNVCVYIPDMGEVYLPETEDGKSPAVEVGDIVRITFDAKEELQMMMSYPGRFAQKARSIEIKSLPYEFRYLDGAFYFAFTAVDRVYREGDEFVFYKSESGESVEYCTGRVTAVVGTKTDVRLSIESGAQDFLRGLMEEKISGHGK